MRPSEERGWARWESKRSGGLVWTGSGSLKKGIMPSGEHEASIVADERFSVGVEIAEHGVATPASYDTNFIRIDASKEEGCLHICISTA